MTRETARRLGWVAWAAIGLGWVAYTGRTILMPHTSATVYAFTEEVLAPVLLLAGAGATIVRGVLGRTDRAAWTLIGVASLLWGAGDTYYRLHVAHLADPPFPSLADAGYLGLYVPAYAGLLLLLRRRLARFHASQWLDGAAAALCVGAAGAALVLPPVLAAATGSRAAVVTNLAYPLADLVILGIVVGMTALTGWRPGAQWALLLAGFALFAVADCLYLWRVATETYVTGTPLDALWGVGLALIGFAGCLPAAAERRAVMEGWRLLAVPGVVAAIALGLLVGGYEFGTDPGVGWLAGGAVAVMGARAALTFRENIALADSHRQAITDALTGLPNRRLFLDRTEQALRAARRSGATVGVMIIDLDRFKDVNDTLGHHAGDELLVAVAERLRAALRESDTVARMGGDEFAVLLPTVTDALAAGDVARALTRAIAAPTVVQGLTLDTEASIGIALAPDHADDVEGLMQRADVAMYQAKAEHLDYEVYRPESDTYSPARLALIGELRRAMAFDELELHYQPKVDLASGELAGLEVLVRWRHPERGMVPPGEFIPLAEHTTLIRPLTMLVLTKALRQSREWIEEGRPVALAVNLSVRNLLDQSFPEEVGRLLERYGVPADLLEFEITETVLMANPARALEILHRLHDLGVGLSIDDFGVGYSSLDYLKRLPVDVIKIDRSFVMNMAHDDADAMIVRSTIDLGRNLGLRVVAEGIEQPEVLQRLRELGCHVGQGFHLGRPVPADALDPVRPVPQAG